MGNLFFCGGVAFFIWRKNEMNQNKDEMERIRREVDRRRERAKEIGIE